MQKEKQLVPQLRFPKFDKVWQDSTLGQESIFLDNKRMPIKESDRRLRNGKYPYYGASGIIDYIDDYIFEGENILLGEDGANILTRNSPLAFLVTGKYWVNNHAHVIKAKGSNRFLAECLERIKYDKYNTGTAQPKLNAEVCKKIKIVLPSLQEQQKIADFFSSIDKHIQTLEKKKAALELYKKGVTQKIFQQEIKFKDDDGNEFPEWENKKVSSVLQERNKKAPKSKIYPLMSFISKIGVHPKGDRYNREFLVNKGNEKKYKQTEYGDFIYSSNNLETGSIGLNRFGSASISPVYSIFKIKETYNIDFINSYFLRKKFINKMIKFRQGVVYGQWKIHESDFLNINDYFPCTEEQSKIANFLSAIDELIEGVAQQIEHSKTYKKGLLQQMFV